MTRLLAGSLAVSMLVACGGDAAPSEPSELTVGQVNGTWRLDLTQTANCTEPAFEGTYYLTLDFSEPASDGGANDVSHWTNDPAVPDRFSVVGNMNVKSGAIVLVLWHEVLVSGAELSGTIADDLTLSGTVVDPRHGFDPVISVSGCEFTVVGHRT